MAKHPNSIKNPLPNGRKTFSKVHIKGWRERRNDYNYHNELKTIHPEYNWVKYVAYVVEAEKKRT